jgi:hypothetical protein
MSEMNIVQSFCAPPTALNQKKKKRKIKEFFFSYLQVCSLNFHLSSVTYSFSTSSKAAEVPIHNGSFTWPQSRGHQFGF